MNVNRLTDILMRTAEDRDYVKDLASWQIAHGCNGMDMTPDQTARFRALEKAGGDTGVAKHLAFGQRQYRTGAMNDDKR